MEKFKSFISEAKDEPYKLVILSHDDPEDPNETGPMIREKAKELGLNVFLGEFTGAYTSKKGNKRFIHSFKVDEKGKAIIPDAKSDIEYDPPFEIDSKDTLIMVRGLGSSIKTGAKSWYVMTKLFEYEGYTVINSTKCHDICNDKWLNQIVFNREGFNTPKTVRINHSEGASFALEELNVNFPVILKTSIGSRGIGVMWIESEKSLYAIVQLLYRENPFIDILLQEYIKTDYDVRVIIAAGEVLGSIKRPIVDGDFRSNVSQGSEPEIHELTELEKSESLRAAAAVDGKVVGVDFIPSKNREKEPPYFIEVNSTPGLIGIEATISKAAAKPIVKDQNRSITKEILNLYKDRSLWTKSDNTSGVHEKFKHKTLGELVGTMDTGNSADGSVIHADSYNISGKSLTLKLNGKTLTTNYLGDYDVITGAGEEKRPKIKLDLEFNGNVYKGLPFTVDDRSGKSTLLMNKDFLIKANLIINPAKDYIL